MDFYHVTFALLVVTCLFVAGYHHKHDLGIRSSSQDTIEDGMGNREHSVKFLKDFLTVYALVMGSDWLQGPYVYTLYKDEKGLNERTVAGLFTCGFLSAAISALFVGSLADKYGRRLACLCFCITYAVSCLTKVSNEVIILFFGRVLGGISTTLLYSVFESWMVTEYFAQDLERSPISLDWVFGIMSTINSIVAITSGIVGEGIVKATTTKVSPFLLAVICLGIAFWYTVKNWRENYGASAELKRLNVREKWITKSIFQERRILVLSLISCCFEGSMYIFVFYWSAAIKSVHPVKQHMPDSPNDADVPFGIIFATFMAAMMLGSLTFTSITSTQYKTAVAKFAKPSALLTLSITGACITLLLAALSTSERVTFWAFCLLEACIGVYYPSMGAQRALIVDDTIRANIYSIIRIPLNIFVVVALSMTAEGKEHRDKVFMTCSGLLLMASLASRLLGEDRATDINHQP